ncbi:MAG TPA: sarcosine oxidase subunit gamma family protein [Steroidobacteraceae bacterium]|nr:sarcosine oxidase subunit gamma family protein [Steroidobacteraceae bacterium]
MVESLTEVPLHAATLRYFDASGPFAAAVPSPGPLKATVMQGGLVLAWLRPTETLALSEEAALIAELSERLARATGGHVVELTGGLKALRLRGSRVAELLSRLGSAALGLRVGEARRGRFADVPVLVVCVRAEEALLVVERAYGEHLRDWIQATLADWRQG